MTFTIVTGGTYTSTGASQYIPLPSSADYFKVFNMTQFALTGTVCVGGEWFGSKFGSGASAVNDGLRWRKAGTNAILIDTFATATATNGFTFVTTLPQVDAQAANAITAISAANPAVVSQTNTYSNGDIVRIYNTTGDQTISGMEFQISSATGANYTLLGLANIAGNGLAAATAGNTRRVGNTILAPRAVNPEFLYVTNISQANRAVVSTSVDPSLVYSVGMKIRLSVPASFGMIDANNVTGTILAVNAVVAAGNVGAYNVTTDINSSTFSAFAFPLSALSPTTRLFATLAPAGASTQQNPITQVFTGYDFNNQPFRTANFTPGMIIGGGAASAGGAANDVINWMSYELSN